MGFYGISKKFVIVSSAYLELKGTLGIVIMSSNVTCKVCFCMAVILLINLCSILYKVNAYTCTCGNK